MPYIKMYDPDAEVMFQAEISNENAEKIRRYAGNVEISQEPFLNVRIYEGRGSNGS